MHFHSESSQSFMHSYMRFLKRAKKIKSSYQKFYESIIKKKISNFMHSYMHFSKRTKSKIHIQTNFMHFNMHFSKKKSNLIHS